MRTNAAALVLVCCLATSSATFRFLKPKPTSQQSEGHGGPIPVVVPVPLPATYARPATAFTKHVTTYRLAPPVPAYLPPQPYPVAVLPQKLSVTYGAPPQPDYAFIEPPPPPEIVEEYYSAWDETSPGAFEWK